MCLHMFMDNTIVRRLMGGPQTTHILANTKTIIIPIPKMLERSGIMSVLQVTFSGGYFRFADRLQDHTEFTTGVNAYLGLEGFYLLIDDEEQALKLPSNQYDVPLAITAKQYGSNGTLIYDTHDNNGVFGDVIQVLDHHLV
jgi:hypothetical protein